jgi:hypothetical protein
MGDLLQGRHTLEPERMPGMSEPVRVMRLPDDSQEHDGCYNTDNVCRHARLACLKPRPLPLAAS